MPLNSLEDEGFSGKAQNKIENKKSRESFGKILFFKHKLWRVLRRNKFLVT